MKLHILLGSFLFTASAVFAQIDSSQKSIPIPAAENKDQKIDTIPTPKLIKPVENNSLSTKKDNMSGIPVKNRVTMKPSEKEFSMMEQSDLIDPGTIFEDKWAEKKRKKQLEMYDNIPPELLGDQFLGDFRTKSGFVNVVCRDFGEQDGDLIQILLNDNIVVARLALTNGYKTLQITLVDGINKIDFLALNQGTLGFNTAEFQLYDDTKSSISKNNWFLATSKKATLILIKE